MLLCHLFVFFDEVSVENFDLFFIFNQVFFLLLNFENSSCIVNNSPFPASFL